MKKKKENLIGIAGLRALVYVPEGLKSALPLISILLAFG